MANFPKELTELVEEYLTDGIISDKERQVLLKKAEKMDVDVDEFDLYIDAQQQKVDQSIDAAASKKRGATCPFCGGPVPQLVDKCPHCGQFITAQASEELKEILEELEDALVDLKSGKNIDRSKATVEKYARKAKLYYSNNPKVKPLLAEIEDDLFSAEREARAREKALEDERRRREKEERDRKRAEERSKTIGTILKTPWFWFGVIGVIGIIVMAIGGFDPALGEKHLTKDQRISLIGFVMSMCAVFATIFYAMHKASK